MPRRDHICPVCELMIEPGQPVSFQRGELLHLGCYEALQLTKKPLTRSPVHEEAKRDDDAGRR